MSSKRRRIVIASLAGLGLVLVGGLAFVNAKIAPTGTGYYAKIMCSTVFVSGLSPERVKQEDLRPYWYVQADVDEQQQTVSAGLFGMAKRTAVYREGLGCTLAIDTSVEELRAATPEQPARPALTEQPWPVGDAGTVGPRPDMGVDAELLDAAVELAFAEPDDEHPVLTRAFVVVYKDQIIAERYAEGITKDTPLLGWSMSKSIGATLVGLLSGAGKLDVHAPAPVPAWQGDERKAITLDQLLRMSSGLAFSEVYGPMSDATHMLFETYDAAKVAIDMPLAAPPDTLWSYSSGTSNIISWIVRQSVEAHGGGWTGYVSYPREQLFDPLGMRTAILEPDPSGTFVGSSFSYMSARDWARFGLLHLHDGVWQGRRILPEGWVTYVSSASKTAPKGEYGGQWWTNVGSPGDPSTREFPSAPTDMYRAAGYQGQTVVVIPSRELVLVRLGVTHHRPAFVLDEIIGAVLKALPEPPT